MGVKDGGGEGSSLFVTWYYPSSVQVFSTQKLPNLYPCSIWVSRKEDGKDPRYLQPGNRPSAFIECLQSRKQL